MNMRCQNHKHPDTLVQWDGEQRGCPLCLRIDALERLDRKVARFKRKLAEDHEAYLAGTKALAERIERLEASVDRVSKGGRS
jgi:hypothetical protein